MFLPHAGYDRLKLILFVSNCKWIKVIIYKIELNIWNL